MTRAIEELLVINPARKCQAEGCRKNAASVITINHAKWRKPEQAALCKPHEAPFIKNVKASGVQVVERKAL